MSNQAFAQQQPSHGEGNNALAQSASNSGHVGHPGLLGQAGLIPVGDLAGHEAHNNAAITSPISVPLYPYIVAP